MKKTKVKIDGIFADLKDLYMQVAEEISPKAALAALAVEKLELEALIEQGQEVQREQPELRETFEECERNLRERLAFLDSITEEVAFADCNPIEPDPYLGLRLVWTNPAMVAITDDDVRF